MINIQYLTLLCFDCSASCKFRVSTCNKSHSRIQYSVLVRVTSMLHADTMRSWRSSRWRVTGPGICLARWSLGTAQMARSCAPSTWATTPHAPRTWSSLATLSSRFRRTYPMVQSIGKLSRPLIRKPDPQTNNCILPYSTYPYTQ